MATLATNRKAYHNYEILNEYEAGIELTGPEVKSAKAGQLNLDEAYVQIRQQGAILVKAYIAPYQKATRFSQTTDSSYRTRRLLLHREELNSLRQALRNGRRTVVPLKAYTTRGLVKIKIALARGKRKYEKKRAQKEREIDQQARRELNYLQNLT